MKDETSFTIDTATLERTATLFQAKRRTFPSGAIEALAKSVINQLSLTLKPSSVTVEPVITDDSLDAFCDALLDPKPDSALRFIEARRADGVSRHSVYVGYVAAAARRLGERWDEDRLSLADVTIGTGNLYALMRAMRIDRQHQFAASGASRSALFATVPGEQHSIGVTMAANMFREAGWTIDLQVGRDHDELMVHIEKTQPAIVGISLSTDQRLDALARIVVAIRIIAPGAVVGVAPGEGLEAQKVRDLIDVDLLLDDPDAARDALDQLLTAVD